MFRFSQLPFLSASQVWHGHGGRGILVFGGLPRFSRGRQSRQPAQPARASNEYDLSSLITVCSSAPTNIAVANRLCRHSAQYVCVVSIWGFCSKPASAALQPGSQAARQQGRQPRRTSHWSRVRERS